MTTLTKPSPLSPLGANAASYERRLKRIVVPMRNIFALLTNTHREWQAVVDDWPKDARLVGAKVERVPFSLVLYLWHPDFLALPEGVEPPEIKQKWERKG